jgi:DNA polymerase III epsilon subunit-like protein
MTEIHGISEEELDDAPIFNDVREHILKICDNK